MKTPYFAHGLNRLEKVVRDNAVGLFFGPPGSGKTFTAESAEEIYGTDRYCALRVMPTPNPASLGNAMALALTGLEHKLDRHSAARVIVKILTDDPRLVVLDEAQNATALGINFVRCVHEEVPGRFPLLFVGGHKVIQRLSTDPALMRRIKGAEFRKLPVREVVHVMRSFHPMFADAEEELLVKIDDECCHGLFGHWAHVANEALDLLDKGSQTITPEVAEAAMREVDAIQRTARRAARR